MGHLWDIYGTSTGHLRDIYGTSTGQDVDLSRSHFIILRHSLVELNIEKLGSFMALYIP